MSEQNIQWTKLADEKSFDIQSEQLHKVKRDDILVIKDDNGFHAINNRCPHMRTAIINCMESIIIFYDKNVITFNFM